MSDQAIDQGVGKNDQPADWWARHRITTRMIAFVVLGVWAYVAIRGGNHFETASWLLGGIFVAITFGINAIDKIAKVVEAWRGR